MQLIWIRIEQCLAILSRLFSFPHHTPIPCQIKRRKMRSTNLTFRSPHHIKGLSEFCKTNSKILLSHFLLLGNEFSSSFQPLFGAYVFNKRKVSNSANMTRPSVSCFEAKIKDKCMNTKSRNQGDKSPKTTG